MYTPTREAFVMQSGATHQPGKAVDHMSAADDLRAMILQAMLEHGAIEPRGFDSIRRRNDLHRQIDDMFDDLELESMAEPA